MKIVETELPGVHVITPEIYRDDRGAFRETWNEEMMVGAGLPSHWVQDNFSLSTKNVLRGIHYQIYAFLALTDRVGSAYKVTDYYFHAGERTLLWNDPELAIAWPVTLEEAIVSKKDLQGKTLREAKLFE